MLLLCRGGLDGADGDGMGVSLCAGGESEFNGVARVSCGIRSGVNSSVSVLLLGVKKKSQKNYF